MIVKIEIVNGMVLLDNGADVMQTRAIQISDIRVFPPEENNPVFGDKYNYWRAQISGECGYIVFKAKTREEALDIQRRVNEVLPMCMEE